MPPKNNNGTLFSQLSNIKMEFPLLYSKPKGSEFKIKLIKSRDKNNKNFPKKKLYFYN